MVFFFVPMGVLVLVAMTIRLLFSILTGLSGKMLRLALWLVSWLVILIVVV